MNNHLQILFVPLLPNEILAVLGLLSVALLVYAFHRRSRGAGWRALALGALLFALCNPVLLKEQREPLRDTALVVVDDSASMQLGDRATQKDQALKALSEKAASLSDLDLNVIHVKGQNETNLFQSITQKLPDMSHSRLAGIILLTDGQTHDVPERLNVDTPLHVLLAGHKGEIDRRLNIQQAPAYGIVGKDITLTLRLDDEPKKQGETAAVTLHLDDGTTNSLAIPVGKDLSVTVPVKHAGKNFFAFTTEALPNELTATNNGIAVNVNGIRDRLRVLLVSGEPHAGERVWRNFLKGDPAVDLVHFTILRSPEKMNSIPNSEMALIAFPIQELFETKLDSFDLIIFDRFHRTGLVASSYLENIARFVEQGGALLISDSTADDITEFLSSSPLARTLPVEPLNTLLTGAFVPSLTETGIRHPVTAPFYKPATPYGHWFRQMAATPRAGSQVLMEGLKKQPLLVLNHVGKGRVAEFTSDQFWLWARHYDGGGPQAELLRRTSHWLMREPELEESTLTATAMLKDNNWQITATERTLGNESRTLTVTDPAGETSTAILQTGDQPGLLHATIPAPALGLYHLKDEKLQSMVMVGANGTPEFTAMQATTEKLATLVKKTGGNMVWLDDFKNGPELHRTNAGPVQNGWGWIGLKRNEQYRVTGSHEYPLWPAWFMLSLLLITTMIAWHREGKND